MMSYQDFRKRQIDTLKIFNDNVIEIKEDEEYTVHFNSSGREFLLTVLLTPQFPHEKPKIVISPPVQHAWCNSTGDIESAPGLLNYTEHSDLGRVVQAIIREMEKFPPPLYDENLESQKRPLQNEAITIPDLAKLSIDELKKLENDPVFFNDYLEELPPIKCLNDKLDELISQIETISRENLCMEQELNSCKSNIANKLQILKEVSSKCEKLNTNFNKKSDQFEPQHIKELLQIASSSSDYETEKYVQAFFSGEIDVQNFINSYTNSKKISAMRKAKEERLTHQLNELQKRISY